MADGHVTTSFFREAKKDGRMITMLTAYDYQMASLIEEAGIDAILVGDTLGNVVLGYSTTIPVTMDDMIHHIKAVTRGVSRAMVVGDMPFMSYHLSIEESLKNAGRILQEGGAQAVKLEGGREVTDVVHRMVAAGIPVMGHIGLTPQSVNQIGGYKLQGKEEAAARKLLNDARALEEAGVFAIVLEMVPLQLARIITGQLEVPTIGIGAGPHCSGQILVTNDMLGIYGGKKLKFVKQYANLNQDIIKALQSYCEEVRGGSFPASEHCFNMPEDVLTRL
ncbi:MAG TPA: 3-methyl-2-oxobutanoate hydroxymethyltransferase [Desulfotomaculum sp.]|nr:MAG: 3-methyl-2-oxobutanoate hydroxymethyltransferase [Desulfotomaculum sp. 46_80]KUK85393.1 MAG: 3-methyl-2-oxobutanoate hydroxymethyltransferase [Desulfofundulus kuznetsovii]HAG10652.1 3-methyl-2-oxobutanoate hydroxymethyltransferase [Desulfotomaculum sp.]HBY03386.1 3-methyl-2-oxobutanoate hydroxymethyltransferase [Desulfotomaculum sp.]